MVYPRTRKEREVWHACDHLWEEGLPLNMTGETIAEKLQALGYHRGSNTDIHRFKKSWMTNKGLSSRDVSVTNKSRPLPDLILLAAKALREEMQAEADQEIQRIQQDANEKYKVLSFELEKLQAERARDLQTTYGKLSIDYERPEKAFSREHQERLLAKERAALQERHIAEMRNAMDKQATDLKQIKVTKKGKSP